MLSCIAEAEMILRQLGNPRLAYPLCISLVPAVRRMQADHARPCSCSAAFLIDWWDPPCLAVMAFQILLRFLNGRDHDRCGGGAGSKRDYRRGFLQLGRPGAVGKRSTAASGDTGPIRSPRRYP
jgi:hypothetical protein